VEAVEQLVASVTITLESKSRPDGLTVRLGDEEIKPALLGVPVPHDAGTYQLEASAPGYRPYQVEVVLADKDKKNLIIPALEPEPKEGSEGAAYDSASNSGSSQAWRRPVAWGAIGVGGAGLLFGTIMGILAADARGKLDCPDGVCPPSTNPDDVGAFRTYRDLSSVGIIAGGILAAGGVTLLLTAPKTREQVSFTPYLGLSSAGVRGTF
jgi:hypothetical protein